MREERRFKRLMRSCGLGRDVGGLDKDVGGREGKIWMDVRVFLEINYKLW